MNHEVANNENEYIPIFTEDNFHRTITNMSIACRSILDYPVGKAQREKSSVIVMTVEDAFRLARSIQELEELACLLNHNITKQFHHGKRRICENPDCHHIYAYFYEDFRYCPLCGTKLTDGTI